MRRRDCGAVYIEVCLIFSAGRGKYWIEFSNSCRIVPSLWLHVSQKDKQEGLLHMQKQLGYTVKAPHIASPCL